MSADMGRAHVRSQVLTADGHADVFSVLVEDSDIDVRGQVAPAELRREVGIHVERVRVDVQFVVSDRHDVVREVENELVALRDALHESCVI